MTMGCAWIGVCMEGRIGMCMLYLHDTRRLTCIFCRHEIRTDTCRSGNRDDLQQITRPHRVHTSLVATLCWLQNDDEYAAILSAALADRLALPELRP